RNWGQVWDDRLLPTGLVWRIDCTESTINKRSTISWKRRARKRSFQLSPLGSLARRTLRPLRDVFFLNGRVRIDTSVANAANSGSLWTSFAGRSFATAVIMASATERR